MSERASAPGWRAVVDVVRAAAERGERCPTNAALAAVFGLKSDSSIVKAMRTAEDAGAITVQRGRNSRIVAAADGSWRTRGEIDVTHWTDTPPEELAQIRAAAAERRAMTPADRAKRAQLVEDGKRAGLTVPQIAERLGIPAKSLMWWIRNQEVKKAERPAARKKRVTRACLRCEDPFQSEGAHNRMCGNCRALSHMDSPYAPNPGGGTGKRVQSRGHHR